MEGDSIDPGSWWRTLPGRRVPRTPMAFVALAVVVTWRLLVTPGIIGLRHDWALPPLPAQSLQALGELLHVWSERSLGARYNLYGFPLTDLALYGTGLLNLDGAVQTRLFLVVALATAGTAAFLLARTLPLARPWALASAVFYVLTPVAFHGIVAGYSNYLVSYSLQPLALALFIRATRAGPGFRRDTVLAGLVTGITWYQPQYIAMATLALGLWAVLHRRAGGYRTPLRCLGLVLGLALALNATVVLTSLVLALGAFDTSGTPIGQTVGYWSVYASRVNNLANALVLTDATFPYFLGTVAANPFLPLWITATVALFGVVYGGTVLHLYHGPRRRLVAYFAALALVSAWLGKGLGEPLGSVTLVVYVQFIPLQGFREFGHALALGAMATGALLGLSLEWWTAYLGVRHPPWHNPLHRVWSRLPLHRSLPPGTAAMAITLALVGTYAWPMLTGDLAANVQTYGVEPDMASLYQRLATDPQDYRVLWLPMNQPVRYPGSRFAGEDPFLLWSPKPTFHPGFPVNGAMGPLTQFISAGLYTNRTEYLGSLLSLESVRYAFLRAGPRTEYQNFSFMATLDRATYDRYANASLYVPPMLHAQRDLTPALGFNLTTVEAWTNDGWLPHAYVADRVFLVAGDLTTLVDLGYLREVPDLDAFLGLRPAFLFLDQLPPGTDLTTLLRRVDGVIVDPREFNDLALQFIPPDDRVVLDQLEAYADLGQPAQARWSEVQQYWPWRDWHYTASLDNPVLTVTSAPLFLDIGPAAQGNWEGYLKAYQSPRSASLDLFLGNRRIGNLNLTGPSIEPRWYPLGPLPPDLVNHTLTLVSRAGFEENRVENPIFEGGWDPAAPAPLGWAPGGGSAALEEGVRAPGDVSVRLQASSPAGASLVGAPFPVVGGTGYYARAWMRFLNAQGTALVVEARSGVTDAWAPVAEVPANASRENVGDAQQIYFKVPDDAVEVRPVLRSGWPLNSSRGAATAWFDDVMVRPDTPDTVVSRALLVRPGALDAARANLQRILGNVPVMTLGDWGQARLGGVAAGGEARALGPGEGVPVGAPIPGVNGTVYVRVPAGGQTLSLSTPSGAVALAPATATARWLQGTLGQPPAGLVVVNSGVAPAAVDMVVVLTGPRPPTRATPTSSPPTEPSSGTYRMDIQGPGPKLVVLTDAYDGWWRLRTGNRTVLPTMVDGGMIGFWLDPADAGTVLMDQSLEEPYQITIAVSSASAVAMVATAVVGPTRLSRWWSAGRHRVRRLMGRVPRP